VTNGSGKLLRGSIVDQKVLGGMRGRIQPDTKPLTNHENFETNGIETGQTLGSIEPAVEKQNPRAALVSGNPRELCI
jgi:hypothetical protein